MVARKGGVRVKIDDPGLLKLLRVLRNDKGDGVYVLIWHKGKLVEFRRTGNDLLKYVQK